MIQSIMEAIDRKSVSFDAAKRERLREAYKAAREAGEDVFVFEDNEYVTDYAKYLLEYLDMTLARVH